MAAAERRGRLTVGRVALWAWVALTLFATLAPLPSDAYRVASTAGSDKAVHFVLFGGLAGLLRLNRRATHAAWAVVVAMAAAGLVELLQSLLDYRDGDLWDFASGALGALLVGVVVGRSRWPGRPGRLTD